MSRKSKKTTDNSYFTMTAVTRKPCSCGAYLVQLVRSPNNSKIGHKCITCGKLTVWEVPVQKGN